MASSHIFRKDSRRERKGPKAGLGRRGAVTTVVFASAVVILIIIAAVGYGLYFMSSSSHGTTSTMSSGSSNYDVVTGLAYAHWTAIGDTNLSGTLSQYSSSSDLWWYVNGSPLNTTAGAYTGNAISSTWQSFFKAGPTYWTVYNYSLTFPSSTTAKVLADVWYVIGSGSSTHTLKLPYELDYNQVSGGTWQLNGDWWGLPSNPGQVFNGVVTPSSSVVTTTTTSSMAQSTSSSASTTTTTSSSGGYGY